MSTPAANGEMPLSAATATFTDGISNTKTHSQHFILIAPWPISDLPNRMSRHFIFICTLLQTPEHWPGSPAMPDADLKQPLSSAPTVSQSFTGNPLTSLHYMEPGLTSNPSTPPILFLFCLISVLFLARDKKSLVSSTDLYQARLNLRVQVEAFLRFWEPQWQRIFLTRKRSFQIPPEHLAWEKGISESPQLLHSLSAISHQECWISMLAQGWVGAGDGEGVGGTSTPVMAPTDHQYKAPGWQVGLLHGEPSVTQTCPRRSPPGL